MKYTKGVFRRGFLTGLAALSVACRFLAGSTPALSQKVKEIKIGVVEPLSGPVAPIGRLDAAGCNLAVEEINAAGGIKSLDGAQLRIITGDTEGKNEVGMSATERVIQQGAVALIGSFQSGVTFVTTQVAERFKTPFDRAHRHRGGDHRAGV